MGVRKSVLILATGLVTLVWGAQPAQASDDWTVISGWSGLSNSRATGWVSYPSPLSEDADGWGRVDWSGTNVEVHAGARDLVNDGWCAMTQIRYQIYAGGSWSNYKRRTPTVDCDINDPQVISKYYSANYPTRYVHFRVCIGYRDGTPWDCTSWK
ncbi:hypothetical protein KBZ10_12310 [Streptomyces sp. F63]|uniref:hypothetical protein n=1 Tax=Streptomyces sp. F63 TaxID=2824887 RepID=UPI001B38DB9E|nr:hypothetical protein [Streptomyces sp. F63]MBQ0985286.1 hypothetical protein [Streptomyces sp. F63]